jgi:hypothetical protein
MINYESLKHITKTTVPYRGSTNRFPTNRRSESHKYFFSDYLDGEQVFRIIYGKTHRKVEVPLERVNEFTALGKNIQTNVHDMNLDVMPFYYESIPHQIGIVRSDNTFEFTARVLGQGVNNYIHCMLFSHAFPYRDSRRGGHVLRSYQTDKDTMHPIFEGLRLDCNDPKKLHESSMYELYGYKVNRKESRTLMAKYAEMFKVSEVMAKNMSYPDMVSIAAEVLMDAVSMDVATPSTSYQYFYHTNEHYAAMRDHAEKLRETAPLDALLLHAMRIGVTEFNPNRLRDTIKTMRDRPQYLRAVDPMAVITNVKRRLSNTVYRENPDVLNKIQLKAGEVYAASDWGHTVVLNGEEVKQYP